MQSTRLFAAQQQQRLVIRRLLRSLCEELGLQRPPLLLESDHVAGPLLTGLLRPAVVLPSLAPAPWSCVTGRVWSSTALTSAALSIHGPPRVTRARPQAADAAHLRLAVAVAVLAVQARALPAAWAASRMALTPIAIVAIFVCRPRWCWQ